MCSYYQYIYYMHYEFMIMHSERIFYFFVLTIWVDKINPSNLWKGGIFWDPSHWWEHRHLQYCAPNPVTIKRMPLSDSSIPDGHLWTSRNFSRKGRSQQLGAFNLKCFADQVRSKSLCLDQRPVLSSDACTGLPFMLLLNTKSAVEIVILSKLALLNPWSLEIL